MYLFKATIQAKPVSVSVFVTSLGQIVKVVKVSNMVHNEKQKGGNVRVNVWTIDLKKYGYNMAEGERRWPPLQMQYAQ